MGSNKWGQNHSLWCQPLVYKFLNKWGQSKNINDRRAGP
jgi:hypothetical protein